MHKNQKGAAHILLILLLLAGIAAGVYLVQNYTNFLPKAGGGGPVTISGDEVVIDNQGNKFSTSPTVEVELNSPYGPPQGSGGGGGGAGGG